MPCPARLQSSSLRRRATSLPPWRAGEFAQGTVAGPIFRVNDWIEGAFDRTAVTGGHAENIAQPHGRAPAWRGCRIS
ncbi:hypothetical protein XFF6992_270072 [Xanthomonas citri pv. fuscans]|nr:hypothetical protein XFF6992_270072 [Xanthomonas citri pv. fuscans]SOO32832.1 hypothetical protein XFF6994_2380002 [Xanthomonas citri pv. fuscans]